MSRNSSNLDYDYYAQKYDPNYSEQETTQARRERIRKTQRTQREIVEELTDEASGFEAGFATTYKPARFETTWLYKSLGYFYTLELIEDVLAKVKGGKEAEVYRCKASETTGYDLLAVKVYRPRQFRNLRNDKVYREGRNTLTASGGPVKATDQRIIRALNKKTAFGAQVAHTSWLMHEYTTLEALYAAGVTVPKPISVGNNAILMQYIGDEQRAAPTLHEVRLDSQEAHRLFTKVIDDIERMLQANVIHGDLSPFNILYWEGTATIIDFPQVVDSRTNPFARKILERDVQRICDYFAQQGVRTSAQRISSRLWETYLSVDEKMLMADFSREMDKREEYEDA